MEGSVEDVLRELELLGTEQTRKIYRRHGVGENQFGVSYANLGKLKKRIKVNHALAEMARGDSIRRIALDRDQRLRGVA